MVNVPDIAVEVLITESSQTSIVTAVGEYEVYGTDAVKYRPDGEILIALVFTFGVGGATTSIDVLAERDPAKK